MKKLLLTSLTAITITLPSLAHTRYTKAYYATYTAIYEACYKHAPEVIDAETLATSAHLASFCFNVADCVAEKKSPKIKMPRDEDKMGKIITKCKNKVLERMSSEPELVTK